MKRAGVRRFRRNLAVAIGNAGDPAAIEALTARHTATAADPLVEEPPGERLHRLRFPSGVREERAVLYDPRRRAPGNPSRPNFIPPGFSAADVHFHNVITEWRATNPAANTFEGARRELLRVGHIVETLTHPMGNVEFNPTARPGSADYGLLYTSGSDLGFSNGAGPNGHNPGQTQRLDSV